MNGSELLTILLHMFVCFTQWKMLVYWFLLRFIYKLLVRRTKRVDFYVCRDGCHVLYRSFLAHKVCTRLLKFINLSILVFFRSHPLQMRQTGSRNGRSLRKKSISTRNDQEVLFYKFSNKRWPWLYFSLINETFLVENTSHNFVFCNLFFQW